MLRGWLVTRFPLHVFGPVACLIALGAAGGTWDPARLLRDGVAALLLLLQFRAWDDIADREADARRDPSRITVTAPSIRPLVIASAAAAVANVVVAAGSDAPFASVSLLAGLNLALGSWYGLRRGRTLGGEQLLLAKYPCFICIVSGGRLLAEPALVLGAGAIVFAGACAYEAWHDPRSAAAVFLGGDR